MTTILFATGNEGKMKEIRMILSDMEVRLLSLKEAGIGLDIEENGSTFEENALIKARAVSEYIRRDPAYVSSIVLADDSGLEIDYLNKEPGIYSARYLGSDTSYRVKNKNLLDRLEGVPEEKRTARFVCAIAAVYPDGSEQMARGVMEGRIGYEEKGSHGFGYDPIFYLSEYQATSAQLSEEEKNKISHRGKALQKMKKLLCVKLQQSSEEMEQR